MKLIPLAMALFCIGLLYPASYAIAHPLPNLRYDRTVHVRVESSGVVVRYVLELNDWTMAIDGRHVLSPADLAGLTGQQAYAKKYGEKKAVLIADNLRASFAGEPLEFEVKKIELEPDRDHPRFRFTFRAPRPAHATGLFKLEDQNFENVLGQLTMTIDEANELVSLSEIVEPTDLRGKASFEYQLGDDERARRVEAFISPTALASKFAAKPSASEAANTADTTPRASSPSSLPEVELTIVRSLWDDLRARGVAAIFDHQLGFTLLLLLCAMFGAAHAFTPGHGKTMVAACLVSERGTLAHAVVLGISTTFAHTGSVILLAILFRYAYGDAPPATTQTWLSLVGGTLITLVGLWLLQRRWQGKVDHLHLGSANHHHAETGILGGPALGCGPTPTANSPHDHSSHMKLPFATMNLSWTRVIMMGFAGGIVPCYDAILVFVMAVNRGKIGLAVPLLIAFSIGLALVLVSLGIVVVLASRWGVRRMTDGFIGRWLPLISAALLTFMGIWFLWDAGRALYRGDGLPTEPPISLAASPSLTAIESP